MRGCLDGDRQLRAKSKRFLEAANPTRGMENCQTATKSSDADSTAVRYVREDVARPSKSMLSYILKVCTIFLKLQVSRSYTVLVVLVGGNLH
jgi:hypothetical protein